MAQREPKQSQLDYLWANFGKYSVQTSDSDKQIPTIGLVYELLEGIRNQAVHSLKIVGKYLIYYNINGNEICKIDISELQNGEGSSESPVSGNTIESFGIRYITNTDVSNGCQFSEGTSVRYLRLSDGREFITGADGYSGIETNSVIVTIEGNQISAKLKLDNEDTVIELSESGKGLKANLKIDDESLIKFTKGTKGLKAEMDTDAYYTKNQIDEKLAGNGMEWNELI